jgi:hypothetical protein
MAYAALFESATGGLTPFPYQSRLAEEGLPRLLRAPTGAGKSAAVVPTTPQASRSVRYTLPYCMAFSRRDHWPDWREGGTR